MASTARNTPEALLLQASRSCGVRVPREELQRALQDPEHGEAFANWARLHLEPDNLLTPEEIALYTMLDQSGEVDRLAGLHDLAEVQSVTENDIKSAIDELKKSTEAISKQTESMGQQQDALSKLVQKTAESKSRRQDFEMSRQRRTESSRKHIAAEVEDLAQSLAFRISDLEQQDADSGTSLNHMLDETLASDDKLLSSLQKLGYELDQQDPEEAQSVEKLREVCMRLIKITVETIRTKLDRLYYEALVEAERNGQTRSVSEDEVKALQEEVESLYSEILPVAQMSVEQQHLEPALRTISSRSGHSLHRTAIAVLYINNCLDYLMGRTEGLRDRIDALKSHQTATNSIINTAKIELSKSAVPLRKPTKAVVAVSPVRRPRAHTTSKADRRRSSGIHEIPPIDALLESLAIYLDDEAGNNNKIQSLDATLRERILKATDVAQSGQESFEDVVNAHFDDVRRAMQLLKDSLLAESPYGEVKLVDPEVDSSIDFLSNEVRQIEDRLELADIKKGDAKSEKKADILRRWGQ